MSENGAFSLSAHPLIFYVNVFSASLHRYRKAVDAYACLQSASFKSAFQGDSAVAQAELARIENERHEIQQLLSPDHHRKLMEKGLKRLSFNATIAALMIHMSVPLPLPLTCGGACNFYSSFFCIGNRPARVV